MVLFSLSRHFNKLVGPPLLRHGLSARFAVGKKPTRDNPMLDALFLIPFAQKMISLEVQEDANEKLKRATSKDQRSAFGTFADQAFDRLFGTESEQEHPKLKVIETMNPRLEAFESYMRPILVPNEKWSDVMRWQFHSRFLNWLRVEFLRAKFGLDLKEAIKAYPKLRMGPQVSMTQAKRKLGFLVPRQDDREGKEWLPSIPSSKTVVKAFQMQNWSRSKDSNAVWKQMTRITKKLEGEVIEIPGTWLRIANIPPEADVSLLSVEEILDVAGAGVSCCGTFTLFCEECNIYQLWTKEYVEGLAAYLLDRTQSYDGDTLVLDVGAGDGFLAQLLREAFDFEAKREQRQPRVQRRTVIPRRLKSKRIPKVVATDDGSWHILPMAPVESLDVARALQKYNKDKSRQVIVLCSWMPNGMDWTALFRDHNIDEYILIGEYDDGSCGDNWQTWGNIDSRIDEPGASGQDVVDSSAGEESIVIPVYESEGYERVELDALKF